MKGVFGLIGSLSASASVDQWLATMSGGAGDPVECPALRDGGLLGGVYGGPMAASSACCHVDNDCVILLSDVRPGFDARALADAYRASGEDALAGLSGSFAVALLDRNDGRLRLAVDRVGARSLYVLRRPGLIAFASRLEGLRGLPGTALQVSDHALFDYLYLHMIPSPGSIYDGVSKLLPAQVLCFDGAAGESPPAARFYWHMPYESGDAGGRDFDTLRAEFRDLMPRVVGDAGGQGGAGPDSRTGCFLSGGTDSSTVAGTWRQFSGAAVPTYSIGFDAEGFDEMAFARIASRHFGTTAREYYVTAQDVVDAVPQVAAYCDEPFGNASIVPAYLCARFAKADGVDVMLAGDGGDEIFGGNERYANQWLFEQYGRVPGPLRALLEGVVSMPGLAALPPMRKARSYIAQAKVPLPDRFETYNFLHRTALAEIFEPDFLARVDTEAPLENLREVYGRTDSRAAVNRMMHLDLKITLADNDLRKVNQACFLAGVEPRYPLLDDRMLAFAASVPPDMQLRRTRLRWFFKRALADFLPPEIIGKRKQGFGLPVGLWMREYPPLKALTDESIAAIKQRGIVRADYIDWVERQHQSSHASYYGVMLWILVMLEQWLRSHEA